MSSSPLTKKEYTKIVGNRIIFFEVKDILPLKITNKVYKFVLSKTTMEKIYKNNQHFKRNSDTGFHVMRIEDNKDFSKVRKVFFKKIKENSLILKRKSNLMNSIYEGTYDNIMKDIEWVSNYEDNYDDFLKKKINVKKSTEFEDRIKVDRNTKKIVQYKEKSTSESSIIDPITSSISVGQQLKKGKRHRKTVSSTTSSNKPYRKHIDKKHKL